MKILIRILLISCFYLSAIAPPAIAGTAAARQTDVTNHGGTITLASPNVNIGGIPAARVGDMVVCPANNGAFPPVPHGGGPIIPPGSTTVLINGSPAARVGDMVSEVVAVAIITTGSPTVLIGN